MANKKTDQQIERMLKLLGGTPYNLFLLEMISKEDFERYTKRYGN